METKRVASTATGALPCSGLTAGAAAVGPNGDPFGAALAGRSRANPFNNNQLGGLSRDLIDDLLERFGHELEDPDPVGSASQSRNSFDDLEVDSPFIPNDKNTPTVEIEILGKEDIPGWQVDWELADALTEKGDRLDPFFSISTCRATYGI